MILLVSSCSMPLLYLPQAAQEHEPERFRSRKCVESTLSHRRAVTLSGGRQSSNPPSPETQRRTRAFCEAKARRIHPLPKHSVGRERFAKQKCVESTLSRPLLVFLFSFLYNIYPYLIRFQLRMIHYRTSPTDVPRRCSPYEKTRRQETFEIPDHG